MAVDEPVYRTVVRFNSVYVIESLPLGDPKTGRDLYDLVVYPARQKLDGLETRFVSVQNRDDLMQCLADIAREVRDYHRLPVIHIEAHGTDNGIQLADGSEITWRTLVPQLAEINRACGMNLFVIAISCMGANLIGALMPSDRAPLFIMVGPRALMSHAQVYAATTRFYETLVDTVLEGGDINRAFEAMNEGRERFRDWPLFVGTAEILFCRVFRKYWEEQTDNERRVRENELVAEIARRQKLNLVQCAEVRAKVRADLADGPEQYERLRDKFLMLDEFPENRQRFRLTFDRCFRGVDERPGNGL